MRHFLKNVYSLTRNVIHQLTNKPNKRFPGSKEYWISRYSAGGNSGNGSYGKLAEYKAEILNTFIIDNNIQTIIEFGCGDGNQLKLAEYPSYIGFDISEEILSICNITFKGDPNKSFKLICDYSDEKAELTLSLDVIYHLTEDNVFNDYMKRLFNSSSKFVIIYASNTDYNPVDLAPHVKHRYFMRWIADMKPEWKVVTCIQNKYPYDKITNDGSFANFYIFGKNNESNIQHEYI